jgi:hypothetical protein
MAIDTNQVLTLTVANLPTFTLVLLGILYNNARLNDLRDLLRAEMKLEVSGVRGEVRDLRTITEKYHNDLLRILADHDHRISRLEDKQ